MAVVHIPTEVVPGNSITLYRAPNLDQDAPRSFQVIPVKLDNPLPPATSIKPPTPPGNAKVSSTPGYHGSLCVGPTVGVPSVAQSSSSLIKLPEGSNDVQPTPPGDLRDPSFAIPTNLLPPLPPSPTNENNTSQPEVFIQPPTAGDGADDDVPYKEQHLPEPSIEVPPGPGSVTESQTPTTHVNS